jgi:signal transduction histidine kinase
VLGVRDYGSGIPRDEHGHIFERFYRVQSARDRNVRGSGIGLALVRHIALAHGGRVTVDSPIPAALGAGPGSLFRVFLPAPVVIGLDESDAADTSPNPVPVVETMTEEAAAGDRMPGVREQTVKS